MSERGCRTYRGVRKELDHDRNDSCACYRFDDHVGHDGRTSWYVNNRWVARVGEIRLAPPTLVLVKTFAHWLHCNNEFLPEGTTGRPRESSAIIVTRQ